MGPKEKIADLEKLEKKAGEISGLDLVKGLYERWKDRDSHPYLTDGARICEKSSSKFVYEAWQVIKKVCEEDVGKGKGKKNKPVVIVGFPIISRLIRGRDVSLNDVILVPDDQLFNESKKLL